MKRRNTFWLACALLCTAACQDDITNQPSPSPEDGTVQVPLTIGFEQEADGYAMPTRTHAQNEKSGEAAFDAQLTPKAQTRTADLQPDALYELHIIQYDTSGNLIGSVQYTAGATPLGEKRSVTLTPKEDCQLVIIARGKDNTSPSIGGNLANIQTLNVPQSVFDGIPTTGATQEQMNKMPYVLHLKSIKVIADAANAGKGIIQSTENGTNDVRLRLKRLATKLTLNWTINPNLVSEKYNLKEVRLCQVPKLFSILPKPEETQWGTTYPSAVAEFVDVYRLTNTTDIGNGSKTVWIPANVRGISSAATAPIHRTKENAPTAASYAELIVDNSEQKERLYYRAYLGGKETTDFNLRENTDYNWNININSTNYTTDPRIQLFDQTPAKSTNLVNTTNCFMLQSGGNLCFNPYQHTSGTNGWNDQLVNAPGSSPAIKTTITSVKVLWQTKDAGTSGDLVLGYVIDDTHHENLANITDAGDLNQARIHVKAPITKGGNAVIAAYNGNTILWSWHVWVTDYVPARIADYDDYKAAQQRTRNGTVHKYRSTLWQKGNMYANMVMMDRELGARSGGYPGITVGDNYTANDAVGAQGLLYQWGRKDPFFGSADGSTNEINVIFDGYGVAKGVTNLARNSATLTNGTYLQYTIEHPLTFLYYWSGPGNSDWWDQTNGNEMTEAGGAYRWNAGGAAAPGKKTIYDPCPDGWKVPMRGNTTAVNNNYFAGSIFDGFQSVTGGTPLYNNSDVTLNNANQYFTYSLFNYRGTLYWKDEYSKSNTFSGANPQGGRLFFLEDGLTLDQPQKWTIHNTFWFPSAAERHPSQSGTLQNPSLGHNWTADGDVCGSLFCVKPKINQLGFYGRTYGWSVRCVQE